MAVVGKTCSSTLYVYGDVLWKAVPCTCELRQLSHVKVVKASALQQDVKDRKRV